MSAWTEAETIINARLPYQPPKTFVRLVSDRRVAALSESVETRAIRDDIVALFAAQTIEVPGPAEQTEEERAHDVARRVVMTRWVDRVHFLANFFETAGIT